MNREKIQLWFKTAYLSCLSVVFLSIGFWITGSEKVLFTLSQFSLSVLLFAMLGFFINLFIVAFRFQRLLNFSNCFLNYKTVLKANLQGNFASLFFISFFGQATGRQTVLQQHGVSVVITTSLTAIERTLIFFVSGALAFISGIFLDFEPISSFTERLLLIEIFSIALLAAFFSLILGRTSFEERIVATILSWQNILRVTELLVITLFSQFFVVGSLVIGAVFLAPDENLLNLIAAAVLISFAASLPISVNGWGIRELAAIVILSRFGIEPSAAMALSILVGLTASAVILGTYPLIHIGFKAQAGLENSSTPIKLRTDELSIEHIMCWGLGAATAILVFFQVHIPLQASIININLADAFAVFALAIVAFKFLFLSERPHWIIPGFNAILFIIGMLLLFSFFRGLLNFGITQWAFSNRLLGWCILIGYMSVGILINLYFRTIGVRRFVETLVLTAVVIIVSQVIIRISGFSDFSQIQNFEGYSSNRNAFAFQLLASLSIAIAFLGDNKDRYLRYESIFCSAKALSFFLAIIIAGILLTGSRAGMITGILLLVMAWFIRPLSQRLIARSLFLSTFFWAGIVWLLPEIFNFLNSVFNDDFAVKKMYLQTPFSNEQSNIERWQTIKSGLDMWMASPVFGAGLGAFYHFSVDWMGNANIIHSTPIWILAEFGLFGATIFLAILFWVLKSLIKMGPSNRRAQAVLMLLFAFLVFSAVHEIFYQRIFWLTLGLSLATSSTNAFKPKAKKLDD